MPIFFLLYFLAGRRLKNIVILIGSIFFYAWGAPKFIFVILGTTAIDFYLVRAMDASENKGKRRLLLSFSLLINLGLLFYFKYSNFFIENVNVMLFGQCRSAITFFNSPAAEKGPIICSAVHYHQHIYVH